MSEPRFKDVSCSQCGQSFGPGDHGYSACDEHTPRNDRVICPACCHQFGAISVDDQEYRARLERELAGALDRCDEALGYADEAVKQRDELRAALTFLYEQVCSLEDYKVTRDVDKHKAEAVFDDAVEQARAALAPQ